VPLVFSEEQLVKAFFLKQRQDRYLEKFANPRKRRKLTDEFCHFKHLDPQRMLSIPPSQQNPFGIYRILKQYGAPDECWVVSDESELDARRMELRQVLEEIVGRTFATFLCCVDGKLGYFENEDGRWILRRA
jgi:hypothetical protein